MIVAQVTDPHVSIPGARLYGGYDPAVALRAVLARIDALFPRPDLVLFTGDLVELGLAEEYAHFLELLAGCRLPCAAIPGNHDRRDAFRTALAGSQVRIGSDPSWAHLAIDDLPLRVIGLDTLDLEGEAGGVLDEGRLAWLRRRLDEAPDRPTLIFMHHPPFRTGIDFMDIWGLAHPERLAAIVARHPAILRISCGHVHRAVETTWNGITAGVCPAVAWQVPLCAPDARPRPTPQAPAFQLHRWTKATGLVTHTEVLTGIGA
ncbi:phosphodiesterase [uncultured Amaricoccus sp.]|uniref:phosphodiesterase n=1 Tax=uncultured Amaricoccus sp. TaxID=339341 RepID=UPI00262B92FE|nr:phosphodiesterase [uncultured Amaricoccus sp.]